MTPRSESILLNDIHSQLNETRVHRLIAVDSQHAVQDAIHNAARNQQSISISGGRHSMGGQQFGDGTIHLDMRPLNRIVALDSARGIAEVEAGIQWPELMRGLESMQEGNESAWGIVQKQTGADRLTIGGALASNVHGRGLIWPPIINDVEAFTLIDHTGDALRCSREQNRQLFSLAIGGYGLFGVITSVALRLLPRRHVERIVEIRGIEGIVDAMHQRIADGYLYGDFQFSFDETSPGFLREGVFACYRPTDLPCGSALELGAGDWEELIALAHFDRRRVYDVYTSYYKSTSGQVYPSDTHQSGLYVDDYHHTIDTRTGSRGSEIITEIYVPRERLLDFMDEARADFLAHHIPIIYGTIRMIEKDTESFLAWAKEPYACIIFNLHVEHTTDGLQSSAEAFRRLIDMAIERGGSYYLTYHRFARRDQVESCYPQFAQFLARKRHYDSHERFKSDWYRHYREMFGE
jgi:FAD/FMN-containing dehydrogenase